MEVEINSGFLTLFPGHDGRNLETCNHFPERKGKGAEDGLLCFQAFLVLT